VIKGGFPVHSEMGEANGSLMTCEPVMQRSREGAVGKAKHAVSTTFVSEAAYENDIGGELGLDSRVRPIHGTRAVGKSDMLHNDYTPDDIEIDAQTFEVEVDGEHVTCEPAEELPLAQRYTL
jgi:urease subunit alpha